MDSGKKLDAGRIAVALGAGGARGLGHILVVEAMDDLGLRPAAISGASMGAVVGAAWAAGVPGREMRAHVQSLVRNRADLMARVLRARVGRFTDIFSGLGNPVLLDGERILDLFWPKAVPDRFEQLQTPFHAVATDFFGRENRIFDVVTCITHNRHDGIFTVWIFFVIDDFGEARFD